MQTQKLSLANIQDKLSRAEMKSIMAGSGNTGSCLNICQTSADCTSICKTCGGTNGNNCVL